MDVPKITIKKILYPTDLSDTGRNAFAYAASLANLYQAKLTVLHVVDERPELDKRLAGYLEEELWEEIKTRDLEEAKDILLNRRRDNAAIIGECVGQYCREVEEGSPENAFVKYDIVVKIGNPADEILAYSKEGEYDLLVIGRHAHGLVHGATHRSLLRYINNHTDLPVLVVQLPQK